MRFAVVGNGGNCGSCEWIEATGDITPETPGDFVQFARDFAKDYPRLRNWLVALNSFGGNLPAAVELGEAFRKEGVVTGVAATVPTQRLRFGNASDDLTVYAMAPGTCESACFFAFVGGRRRTLDLNSGIHQFTGSTLGIHRFAPDQEKQSVTSAQQLSGMLSAYLSRMGVDPAILAVEASVPEGQMHKLTQTEAARFAVVNMGLPPPSWTIQRTKDARALVASLKGTVEGDASEYNAWDYEAVLSCQRTNANRISLVVQISGDSPFPEGEDKAFTFGLRWQASKATYSVTAATSGGPASTLRVFRDETDTPQQLGSFDLRLASSAIREGKMILTFLLGPKSIALVDRMERLWLVTDWKSHVDAGWLPDEIPLPWQQRANISGLLRNNCIVAGDE
jgi:hypothetical protein